MGQSFMSTGTGASPRPFSSALTCASCILPSANLLILSAAAEYSLRGDPIRESMAKGGNYGLNCLPLKCIDDLTPLSQNVT